MTKGILLAGTLLTGLLLAAAAVPNPGSAESAREIPAPKLDATAQTTPTSEVAVLAGGCFWGVQGVFQHVKGVSNAVSGYAGGKQSTAQYELVGTAPRAMPKRCK